MTTDLHTKLNRLLL